MQRDGRDDHEALASGIAPRQRGLRARLALRLAVVGAAVVALAAVGALGYAGVTGKQAARSVTVKLLSPPSRSIDVAIRNAAADQYAGTRDATTGIITVPQVSVPKLPTQSAPSTVSATLTPDTATLSATLSLKLEPVTTPSAGFGGGSTGGIFVKVEATDTSTNSPVTQLPAPLAIRIGNPPAGFSPAYSSDGVTFRGIPSIAPRTTLNAGEQDGYYLDGTTVVILTRHLTIFGMVKPELITIAAGSPRRPAAGSGLFGDPTRSKAGAPALAIDAVVLAKSAKTSPTRVIAVSFSLNEQAALYFSVVDPRGRDAQILGRSSGIRGRQLTGSWVKSLHVVVLSPAEMTAGLAVSKRWLAQGGSFIVTVRAVDFDGNKTVKKFPIVVP